MTLDGTNTWVLRAPGAATAVVVDPGPEHAEHLRTVAGHGPVAAVLVTHGHADHTEGVRPFRALAQAPVYAVDPAWCVDAEPLVDGAELVIAGLRIRVLATPGHTADSACFLVGPDNPAGAGSTGADATARDDAVLTGDTVLGRGTTVVAFPDGDLGDYLASLRRLEALGALPALPGHGPALADCAAAAGFYLAHREARLAQVRDAVAAGARTPGQVVDRVYADVDPNVRWAAEMSVRAQLAYLETERAGSDREHTDPGTRLDRP